MFYIRATNCLVSNSDWQFHDIYPSGVVCARSRLVHICERSINSFSSQAPSQIDILLRFVFNDVSIYGRKLYVGLLPGHCC